MKPSITPIHLTIEVRTSDGLCTEFYQEDPKRIQETLRLLSSPRPFAQPQLVLASQHCVSAIATRAITVILVRTPAALPEVLAINSPAGPVDISEVQEAFARDPYTEQSNNSTGLGSRTFRVEVHALGGWTSILEVRAQVRGTVQDRRHTFAHVFGVPVLPFKLATGGFGLINPNNLTRITAYPPPDSLPETALPMELLEWTQSRSEISSNITYDHSY